MPARAPALSLAASPFPDPFKTIDSMDHSPLQTSWEDMPLDCLSIIFSKLGIGDLTASVHYVCKSWYQASSHPALYRVLDTQLLDLNSPHSSATGILKLAMARSRGAALELRLSSLSSHLEEILSIAAISCPGLIYLSLPGINFDDQAQLLNLISRWRDLEWLEIESKPTNFRDLAEQIGIHCSSFRGLKMCGTIEKEDVFAILNFLPKIEILDLSGSRIDKESVLGIMDGGSGELKRLSLKNCVGFDESDEEVRMRGKGMEVLELDGSFRRVEEEEELLMRNIANQRQALEQMLLYYDDCFELWMF